MLRLETHPDPLLDTQTLLKELAALRAENSMLRSRLSKKQRYSVIVRRAVVDGHTVIMARYSGESAGCLAMQRDNGMTRGRWCWAVAFLRYAGVVSLARYNWRDGLVFLENELTAAVALLEKAALELEQEGGYKRLRLLYKR